jgi:putative transposase
MIVFEFKIQAKKHQLSAIDEAIRITQFVRNKCLKFWLENKGIKLLDLNKYCKVIAKEFDFADKLNSMARQAASERTALAIKRFYDNCKSKKPGKKGFPKFQKNNRSVEYKTCGWKLSEDRKYITFTDKCGIGQVKLIGTWDLHFYQINQIKRVRIVRRCDGYYCQFCIDAERNIEQKPSGKTIGLDVGLNHFYTDSNGDTVENPRFLRKSEKSLKRLQKQVSRKKKGSKNRLKAIKKLGKKHSSVSRQRKDFAVKTALCVVKSYYDFFDFLINYD